MAWKGRPAGDRDGRRGWSSGKRPPGLFGDRLRDGSSGGFLETQDKALAAKTSANATGPGWNRPGIPGPGSSPRPARRGPLVGAG